MAGAWACAMTGAMRLFPLLAAAAAFLLSACNRHEWETKDGEPGVKELYTHHGDDHGDHAEHGEGEKGGHGHEKEESH